MERKIDPIIVAVLDSRFSAIIDQMARTLERTSRSPIFAEARDYVTAIFTKDLRLIAQKDYIAVLASAIPVALENIAEAYKGDIHEGDIFIHNDVYAGGNHLPDVNVVKPVFYKGELLFWSVVKGHQADLGGRGVAGYDPTSTTIWDDGLIIPACKLYQGGKLNRGIRDLISRNNKLPEIVWGDILCEVGGVTIGERIFLELLDRYGAETLYAAIDEIIAATEKETREKIKQIPDGVYYGEKSIDHDAINRNKPVTVRVKIIKQGDEITIDLSDSDPQTVGYVNSSWANTYSSCHLAMYYALPGEPRRNEGSRKPIKVVAAKGTVVNPEFPAPVTMCTVATVACIAEAIWLALAPVIPQWITPAQGKGPFVMSRGFNPRTKRKYINFDALFHAFSSSGTMGYDGWPTGGATTDLGTMRIPDPEICELTFPIHVLCREWEIDSAGAGEFRGGPCHIYRVQQLVDTEAATTTHEGMRDFSMPFGMFGGKNARASTLTRYTPDGRKEEIDCFRFFDLKARDILEAHTGAGAGFGSPFKRDIEKVREDVKNELVSIRGAKEDYGVIVDPVTLEVDVEATKKLRGEQNN